jgi:hypothetical protein
MLNLAPPPPPLHLSPFHKTYKVVFSLCFNFSQSPPYPISDYSSPIGSIIIIIFICFLLNAKSSKTHLCEPARRKKWWGTEGGGPVKPEEENMNKKDMVWSQLSLKADHQSKVKLEVIFQLPKIYKISETTVEEADPEVVEVKRCFWSTQNGM